MRKRSHLVVQKNENGRSANMCVEIQFTWTWCELSRLSASCDIFSSLKQDSPKKPLPSLNDDDDDGSICSICLDTWESKGIHRLVALKCGHLFGENCIKRWVKHMWSNTISWQVSVHRIYEYHFVSSFQMDTRMSWPIEMLSNMQEQSVDTWSSAIVCQTGCCSWQKWRISLARATRNGENEKYWVSKYVERDQIGNSQVQRKLFKTGGRVQKFQKTCAHSRNVGTIIGAPGNHLQNVDA